MAEIKVGIRQLKAELSAYLRKIKAGNTVVITERGKPVGRIAPVQPSPEERLEPLILSGFLSWNGKKFPSRVPTVKTGRKKTMADLVLENRG